MLSSSRRSVTSPSSKADACAFRPAAAQFHLASFRETRYNGVVGGFLTLAIAEDDDEIRDGLREIVDWERLGYRVVADFADGEELIAYLRRYDVDVVLTDIRMSLVSGIDVAKFVHEEGRRTEVVLLSGYKEFDYARSAIRYAVADYLLKPVELDEIDAVFSRIRNRIEERKAASGTDGGSEPEYDRAAVSIARRIFESFLVGALEETRLLADSLALLEPVVSNGPCAVAVIESTGATEALSRVVASESVRETDLRLYPVQTGADRSVYLCFGASTVGLDGLQRKLEALFERVDGLVRPVTGRAVRARVAAAVEGFTAVSTARLRCSLADRLGAGKSAYQSSLVDEAKSYISAHYADDLSLDDVAGHACLSPVYFSRLFKQATGTGFVQYLTALRVNRAIDLLENTSLPAGAVAEQVGYRSLSYFSKVFKKHTGHTPRGYRNAFAAKR